MRYHDINASWEKKQILQERKKYKTEKYYLNTISRKARYHNRFNFQSVNLAKLLKKLEHKYHYTTPQLMIMLKEKRLPLNINISILNLWIEAAKEHHRLKHSLIRK